MSLSWKQGDIDMPEVCNHLARHFKVHRVTVLRRSKPGHTDAAAGGRFAVLRISGLEDAQVPELQRSLSQDPHGLAQAIVSSGT